MRILKIELQNINSLRCDNPIVIDFENDRFQDVGLFAITGPTGAGKTTLLDAITIALYRKVPRFEKSNGNARLEDVVSYGAATALARITFEAKNQRYEAQWDMRLLSNSGKSLGKPVENVRLKNLSNEKIIAETKTACDEKIAEITQLNYDQFLRSVLLAQGEFAAFLSAKNAEKGLLLQQIAGDEIYRKIGETLKNKIADEKKILEQIRSKINTDDLLNEETENQLKNEENDLFENQNKIDDELKIIAIHLNWFEQKNKLEHQRIKIEEEKQRLKLKILENAAVFQLLEKHEAAEPLKAILNEVSRLEQEIEKKNKRIITITNELIGLEIRIKDAIKVEISCKNIVAEKELLSKTWHPKLEQVIAFDTEIRANKAVIIDKGKVKEDINKSILNLNQSIEDKSIELKSYVSKLELLHIYLNQNQHVPLIEKNQINWNSQLAKREINSKRMITLKGEIDKGKVDILTNKTNIEKTASNIETESLKFKLLTSEIDNIANFLGEIDIENLIHKNNLLNEKKEQLRELIQLLDNRDEKAGYIKDFIVQKTAISFSLAELSTKIKHFEEEILEVIQSVKDAEELYEKDSYIVSLETERRKLKHGEPCTLCGSTEHPMVQKYMLLEISESKKRVEDRKDRYEKLNAEKKVLELEEVKYTTNLNDILLQIDKYKKETASIQLKFETLNSIFKIEDKTEIKSNLLVVDNEQIELTKQITASQEQQKLKNKKESELKTIEAIINRYKLTLTQLSTTNSSIKEANLTKDDEYQSLQTENNEIERQLVVQLADCEMQLPDTEHTTRFIAYIDNLVKSYNENLRNKTAIENVIKQCNIEKENYTTKLNEKKEESENLVNQIADLENKQLKVIEDRETILPLNISTETKRRELQLDIEMVRKAEEEAIKQHNILTQTHISLITEKNNIENEQQQNRERFKISYDEMSVKIQQSVFEQRYEVLEALLPDDVKVQYLETRNEIVNGEISIAALEKNLIHESEILESKSTSDLTFEEINEKNAILSDQKNRLLTRMGEITESFRKDAQIKDRNAEVIKQINSQEIIYRKWTSLMNILGGSQEAFNTYVQRLTLKNLIDLANLHLYKLNRRYSLQLNPQYKTGEELNFKLIDHFQADEPRLVDTSSGGEKFLISLSLALGLSDLASHNVSIGSLFIDEGFGTLDSNTLEIVISSLETLKAQGKTIGIISHVDSLKERIPVQIQVTKRSNGISVVDIL